MPTPKAASNKAQPQADASILSTVDWPAVEASVRAQQRSRERHTPPISMFRWWARRSHALIGALLDQAPDADGAPVISDPFSGGGTVAIEAARRGLSVFAQDLHPWAVAGLRGALSAADVGDLESASARLLKRLAPLRTELYGTSCPQHGDGAEALGAFWVRVRNCPGCDEKVHLFPYAMITRASRRSAESHSWWGCVACGHVTCSAARTRNRRCGGCGRSLPEANRPLLANRIAICPNTRCRKTFAAFDDTTPEWRCVLVQRACKIDGRTHAHFDRPTAAEMAQATRPVPPDLPAPIRTPIPAGLETRVLHRAGLRRWEDLYTSRQLVVLTQAKSEIDRLRTSAACRDRLRLALAGCAEMAGHVSRWDRFYPKAFEATANHRFAVTGLSYETNLLAERGRGSMPRRLCHSATSARWNSASLASDTFVGHRSASSPRSAPRGVQITQGSSTRQLPRTATVDLVLTDPPYFDDVQYAELAAVFLAWARAVGLLPDSTELDLSAEAVANPARGTGVDEYRGLLTAILNETRRTLKPDGRIVLTYHNTDLRAWWALGRALRDASLQIRALAVAHAENERDHAKRDRLGFSRDLVIECRRRSTTSSEPDIVWFDEDDPEARELVVAGRCIASIPVKETIAEFRARFREMRGDLRPVRISRRGSDEEDIEQDA